MLLQGVACRCMVLHVFACVVMLRADACIASVCMMVHDVACLLHDVACVCMLLHAVACCCMLSQVVA